MRSLKIIKYVLLLAGLGALAVAIYFVHSTTVFLASAAKAEGTVVAVDRSESKTARRDGPGYEISVSYKPVVDFVAANGEKITLHSIVGSDPPMYHKGQKVEVVYLPEQPHQARINDFLSLWLMPLLFGVTGGVFFLVGGGMILASSLKARSDRYLRSRGVSIKTEFQRVITDTSLVVNGRHPYRIFTQWQNPATGAMHVFQSDQLWFDPTSHIGNREITVFIERNNPRKYYVDLSFLPQASE